MTYLVQLLSQAISVIFSCPYMPEKYIRISINLEYLHIEVQDQSTIRGRFEIPTNLLQSLFMRMLEKNIYLAQKMTAKEMLGHDPYNAAVLKITTARYTILILE